MLHSNRPSLGARRVSPPQPTCMSTEQKASYLADLRSNRPARPIGSRPLPSRPASIQDENLPPRAESALALRSLPEHDELPARAESALSLRRDIPSKEIVNEQKLAHRVSLPSTGSYGSLSTTKGRPLVATPLNNRRVSPPQHTAMPEMQYRELTYRQRERDEAHSLRQALEKLDHKDDELRLHEAAKLEAADLVWRHQNPDKSQAEKVAAYRNPDLEKQRSPPLASTKLRSEAVQVDNDNKTGSRSVSGGSTSSTESKRPRLPWLKKRAKTAAPAISQPPAPKAQASEGLVQRGVRRISGKRQSSSGSTKGMFRNPQDEIYEENAEISEMPVIVESPAQQLPLQSKLRNSLPRGTRPLPEKSYTFPLQTTPQAMEKEVRDAQIQNNGTPAPASRTLPVTPAPKEGEQEESDDEIVRYIDGYEVRSDDIRAATSMRKSDRSPNLPTPTAVSDRPGRPIVSFDKKWKPGSDSPRGSRELERPTVDKNKNNGAMSYPVRPTPSVPQITIKEDSRSPALLKEQAVTTGSVPSPPTISISVPTINISVEEPAINVQPPTRTLPQITVAADDNTPAPSKQSRSLPQINISNDAPIAAQAKAEPRPLPAINPKSAARPLPHTSNSAPARIRPTQSEIASRVPWLTRNPTSTSASTVTCAACTLPIAGRIVTASGSSERAQKARFHPECFTCHQCSEGLEAVAFYPEPDTARLERITASLPDLAPDSEQIQALVHSNQDLRFFCHLDYHEFYSPRCHNCKTPIEGAVILALGRHYHADHFFCAECGDPFSSESPFVEHNDYPYCVSCHTKRTSARCRACRAPILNEMTIEALGGKWHDQCFVCCDCSGDFGEDGRFFVREVEVELTDKQKRRGMGPVVEEKAACQACEERRLKNAHAFL